VSQKANQEMIKLLGDIEMFQGLDEADRGEISGLVKEQHYDAGKEIFQEGDPGGELFIIGDGSVEVHKLRSHGTGRIVIARFERGGVIGEMSLIDGMPRSATVVATRPTKMLMISEEALDELTVNNPQLAIKLFKGMARLISLRLRNTSGWFADVF